MDIVHFHWVAGDLRVSLYPLVELGHVTRLVLCHNKISELPDSITELRSLEYLSLFDNQLEVSALHPPSINILASMQVL